MINAIGKWIVGHSGLPWILGENFFIGYLPLRTETFVKVPERVMVALERTPAAVSGYLPDFATKAVQIWNRARTYQEAKQDAEEIYQLLHGAAGWELPAYESGGPDFYAMVIDAIGTPAPIANPNENGLFEFSTNYVFQIEQDPTVP